MSMQACFKRMCFSCLFMFFGISSQALAMTCIPASAPQLVFGKYDPQAIISHDVQTTLGIQCIPNFSGEQLNLTVRLSGNQGKGGLFQMHNPVSNELLAFYLFQDPALLMPVDEQTNFSFNAKLLVPTIYSLRFYGRIPAREDVSPGIYLSDVIMIITY